MAPEQGPEGQDADSPIWIPDRLIRPAKGKKKAQAPLEKTAEEARRRGNEEDETRRRENESDLVADSASDSERKEAAD